MTPSTTLSICFNKKNSKLILQIDFSQMDTETETKNELTREEISNLLKENNDWTNLTQEVHTNWWNIAECKRAFRKVLSN